ncbi:MAG TPA: calcium-binding protein [Rhizomicrobium sp.]|nr:calcium-binding protein [Rhizomicrobium sp.]
MTVIYQTTNLIGTTTQIAMSNGDTAIIANGVQVATTGAGNNAITGAAGSVVNLQVNGSVFGAHDAFSGTYLSLVVGSQGSLTGGSSAIDVGASADIVNNGLITAFGGAAITLGSAPSTIENNGTIAATQAVRAGTGSLTLNNSTGGVIDGNIELGLSSSVTISNAGMITGNIDASTGFAFVSLHNSGTIIENLYLSETGAQIVNTGTLQGIVEFGGGDNVFNGKHGIGDQTATTFGSGDDTFAGGAGDDTFDAGAGVDIVHGNGGDDTITVRGENDRLFGGDGDDAFVFQFGFAATDRIDGGDGNDTLKIGGNYSVVFDAKTLVSVENIILTQSATYNLTTANATVADGATLTVDGSLLYGTGALTFDGSREKNGAFDITGGAGADTLTGGAGDDVLTGGDGADKLTGGRGADTLSGGVGADVFVYHFAAESTGVNFDTIVGFSASSDRLQFGLTITAVDPMITSGTLTSETFDSDLAAAMDGHLGANHAEVFAVTAGEFAGHKFLVVDANGVAGYQSGHDYVIDVTGGLNLANLGTGRFI